MRLLCLCEIVFDSDNHVLGLRTRDERRWGNDELFMVKGDKTDGVVEGLFVDFYLFVGRLYFAIIIITQLTIIVGEERCFVPTADGADEFFEDYFVGKMCVLQESNNLHEK